MGVPTRLNIRFDSGAWLSANLLIWLSTALAIIVHPVATAFYWGWVLEAGVLRHDADSIGLPIFASVILTMIAAIPMLGLTKLALVSKSGPFRLWSWNGDRPILSTVWSLGLGGPAITLTSLTVMDFIHPWPWYEYVWIPRNGALVAWLLVLRGAALSHPAPR